MLTQTSLSHTHTHTHNHTVHRSWFWLPTLPAAFISVCLDTIYYQLFILVFSTSLCLSLCLPICLVVGSGLLDFSDCLCVCLSVCVSVCVWCVCSRWVCLSPSSFFMWVSFPCLSPRGSQSVCLVCHFISPSVPACVSACGSQSGCDGLWARLGFDHDLLPKPCGRSHRAKQPRPQSTWHSSSLSVALPALASQAHACLQANETENRLAASLMNAHKNKTASTHSLNPVYWAWLPWQLVY